MKKTDIAIIGGGVAGLSAAMYARRFNLDVTIFDGFLGGTIARASQVENYPGFEKITGIELSNKLREHALSYNPNVVNQIVKDINKKACGFIIKTDKEEYESKAVIFVTGAKAKTLGIKGEKELFNRGVHECVLCDGGFYKDKIVAVVGSGNSAAQGAIILSGLAKKIFIIARKNDIHPEPVNYQKIKELKNVEVITNTNITEFIGEKNLTSIKLDKPYKGKDILELNGVFINIGYVPNSNLAKNLGVKLNKKAEIITNKDMETNIKGFYAGGDVTDSSFNQAITSASEGVIAAYSAYNYITKNC